MSATPKHRPAVAWTTAVLAAASFAAVASLVVFAPKSEASSARTEPTKPIEPPDSPLSVAETLDAIIQPRFFKLNDENFGMSRIARRAPNHPLRRFRPESDTEKVQFDRIAASGRDCHILFYQTVPALVEKPLFSRGNEPLRYIISGGAGGGGAFNWNYMKEFKPIIEAELPRLKAGEKRNRETNDFVLALRPVHSAQACVSCHAPTSSQDILGVMVYVVSKARRTPAPVSPQAQQRQSDWQREVDEVIAAK